MLPGMAVGALFGSENVAADIELKHEAKDFSWEPYHHLAMVPLVLSGPLCPFGTSPHPVGSHPFQGRHWVHKVKDYICRP